MLLADDNSFEFEEKKNNQNKQSSHSRQHWSVLVVDDDEQVHEVTEFALMGVNIQGRYIDLIHAYSASEAQDILRTTKDIAVIFLDVVMETENAGLDLIRVIREELGLQDLRIILRTGQPGYAPELDVIRDYDINDYRTKSELTHTRLITSLTAAIRSYEQIWAINYSRQGLTKIINSSAVLFENQGLESMSEGVLLQLAGLVQLSPNGLVCAQRGCPLDDSDSNKMYVLGAVGRYTGTTNLPLESLGNKKIEQAISNAMMEGKSIHTEDYSVLYLDSGDREEAVYMDSSGLPEPLDVQLLEVFTANISVGFSNVFLFNKLNHMAYHDSLTHLPNRSHLHIKAREMLKEAKGNDCSIALMLFDLDRFKEVNDTLGHHTGDNMLKQVGEKMTSVINGQDAIICRLGGDEFVILLKTNNGIDHILAVADQLRENISQPIEVNGIKLEVACSIGISCYPMHGQDSHELLRTADVAMYESKRKNASITVYDDSIDIHTTDRLAFMSELGEAIRSGQLILHYQPKQDIHSGDITGLEALVRWNHPRLGLLYPDAFIELVEMCDLIHPFTLCVLKMALNDQKILQSHGYSIPVSVNLSARNLINSDCLTGLQELVEQTGMSYELIELELTETALMNDTDAAAKILRDIAKLGVKIIVDDYGTGFSSLAYLRSLPLSTLKIDRSFVSDMTNDNHNEVIVQSTIALAHNLGLKVTAEGVENAETLQMLQGMQCDEIQGYHLCKPVPLNEVNQWLSSHSV